MKGRRDALGIGDGAAEGVEVGPGDGIAVEGIGEGALDGIGLGAGLGLCGYQRSKAAPF